MNNKLKQLLNDTTEIEKMAMTIKNIYIPSDHKIKKNSKEIQSNNEMFDLWRKRCKIQYECCSDLSEFLDIILNGKTYYLNKKHAMDSP